MKSARDKFIANKMRVMEGENRPRAQKLAIAFSYWRNKNKKK